MRVLPIFSTAYSFRSILQPKDIVEIAKKYDIKKVVFSEDNMVGFLDMQKYFENSNFVFGLRISVTNNIKDEKASTCKYLILAKNASGYKRLLRIYSFANKEGAVKMEPRIDFDNLKNFWNEDDLSLLVPFYDSFIFKNLTTFSSCQPDFSFAKPTFLLENNGLFFDSMIARSVEKIAKEYLAKIMPAQTIYYETYKDFDAWQTYKCILNRSSLRMPNLEHCSSDSFCVEHWKYLNEQAKA